MNFQRIEQLSKEISHLRNQMKNIPHCKEVISDVWEINVKLGQKIGLVISVLVHGNETGGVAVLNEALSLLANPHMLPPQGVCIILGNVKAALEGKRFIDRDLNRSFGKTSDGSLETARALELSPFLERALLYLDIHQTFMPSDRSFFIFPYQKEALQFAREILPRASVVTHWGRPFSSEGMCTDQFVGTKGGVGLTLELGQNGFDANQISVGVHGIMRALVFAKGQKRQDPSGICGPLFTWKEIIPWPETGNAALDPNWTNFQPIEEGQRMGIHDGKVILAPTSGWMIFPKYFTPEVPQSSRPAEMYRIMKKIEESELPNHT